MSKKIDEKADDALNAESLSGTTSNIEQTEVIAPVDSAVEAQPTGRGEDEAGDGFALNGVGENVGIVDGETSINDPRVESRDIVRTAKTAEMADRVAEAGFGIAKPLPVSELLTAVPVSPSAGQPLDIVAYEEYTAEVAALNAESAAAALKLTSAQRAQRVQELQRVSASAYED